MKKNDILAVVVIALFAAVFAFVGANYFIGSPQNNPVEVEQVTAIKPEFATPDARIFNDKAIDPTVTIKGSQSSSNPFSN